MSISLPTERRSHVMRPADHVPISRKLGYGSGMIAYAMMMQTYNQFANPIFNDMMGVSPILIGWVLAATRFWDGLVDLVVGNVSDNTRSRWGRRRPWIAVGALTCAISFAVIWWFPRGHSEMFYVGWLLISSLVFYVAFSAFSVPYIAMGMELTPDYNERSSVMAWRSVLAQTGHLLIAGLFWFTSLKIFSDRADGMRYAALILAGLILCFGLLPAFFSREHPSMGQRTVKQKPVPFLVSIRETIHHWAFLNLVLVTVASLLGLMMVGHLGYYVMTYHVFGGDKSDVAGRVLTITQSAGPISTVLAIPLLTLLSRKIGKRRACVVAFGLALVGTLLKWPCYTPEYPMMAIIPSILLGPGTAAAYSLVNAMIPDVVDLDELKTGERREGMFSAIYGWTMKLGTMAAACLSGYVLPLAGFDVALGAAQSPHALFLMRVSFTLIPALAMAAAILLILIYPLSEARSYEIRQQLEKRR